MRVLVLEGLPSPIRLLAVTRWWATVFVPCNPDSSMAATTTIRLPPELRARLNALAEQTGRSAHSLIV